MELITKQQLLGTKSLPDFAGRLLRESKVELNSSLLPKERVYDLYKFRLERLENVPEYRDVIKGMNDVFSNMEQSGDKMLYLINIISDNKYLNLFFDSRLENFYGCIDLTGKGNTDAFLGSN